MVLLHRFIAVCMFSLALLCFVRAHGEHKSALHESEVTHDRDHIKEHLKDEADINVDALSDEDMHFYYFTLHDYDGNKKLDGLEMYHGIEHHQNGTEHRFTEEENAETVDYFLDTADLNSDGYIDYPEFIKVQNAHHHNPQ
ncbi:hypothetical protein ACROYT_G039283 [Oculina patagonica]